MWFFGAEDVQFSIISWSEELVAGNRCSVGSCPRYGTLGLREV